MHGCGIRSTLMTMLRKPLPQDEYGPPDRWWILTFVALAYFVLILHRMLVFYIQVPLSEELGLTKTERGMLDPAFIVPYGVAQVCVAYWSDRFRRRTILAYSLLASAIALAATGLTQNFAQLMTWRIVLGLAQAASVPAIAGVMADCFTSKNRSTAIGVYFVSLNLATMVAGKYGGRFADMAHIELPFQPLGFASTVLQGWRIAMFCFAFVGVISAMLVHGLMREPERTERDPQQGLGAKGSTLWGTIRSVLAVRSYWMLAVAYLLFCIVANVQDFWLAAYFVEDFGMTNEAGGQFATIWSRPSTIVGLLLGGFWADRWARGCLQGRTLVQVVGMVACVPALYLLGIGRTPELLAGTLVVFGLGYGFYVANLWTTTFEIIDPAARSTAVGLLNVIGTGAAPAAPIVGYLAEQKISGLGESIAGLSILAGLIVVLLVLNVTVFLRRDYRGDLSVE